MGNEKERKSTTLNITIYSKLLASSKSIVLDLKLGVKFIWAPTSIALKCFVGVHNIYKGPIIPPEIASPEKEYKESNFGLVKWMHEYTCNSTLNSK